MKRPSIFIGGSGRSGTTLLFDIIREHPRVWGGTHRYESHLFAPPDPSLVELAIRYEKGPVDAAFLRRCKAHVLARFKTKFGVDAARLHSGMLPKRIENFFASLEVGGIPREAIYEKIGAMLWPLVWGPHQKGAAWWVEKSPWDVVVFDHIERMFPGSKYIHIIRDPRDVIDSVAVQKWGPNTVVGACSWYEKWFALWEKAIGRGVRRMPNYLELRYEMFVRVPFLWKRLWEFLRLKAPPRPALKSVNECRHRGWEAKERAAFATLAAKHPRLDELVAETNRITGKR